MTHYGSLLASIHSDDDNHLIWKMAIDSIDLNSDSTSIWIGLNDIYSEGDWQWIDYIENIPKTQSLKQLGYTNWHDIDTMKYQTGSQDCAEMIINPNPTKSDTWKQKGKWNDRDCSVELPFVCDATFTLPPTQQPSNFPSVPPTTIPTTPTNTPTGYPTVVYYTGFSGLDILATEKLSSNDSIYSNYTLDDIIVKMDYRNFSISDANEYCMKHFNTTLATISSQSDNDDAYSACLQARNNYPYPGDESTLTWNWWSNYDYEINNYCLIGYTKRNRMVNYQTGEIKLHPSATDVSYKWLSGYDGSYNNWCEECNHAYLDSGEYDEDEYNCVYLLFSDQEHMTVES